MSPGCIEYQKRYQVESIPATSMDGNRSYTEERIVASVAGDLGSGLAQLESSCPHTSRLPHQ